MGFTIADQYYIKALDNYPFDLPEAIENLNYALSYSNKHSNANCLMGRVYSEQLNNTELAVWYFEQALSQDLVNLDAIRYYAFLLIKLNEFEKANKLIDYGYTIKGANKALLLRYKALIAERNKDYKRAVKILKDAINEAYNKNETDFLKSEKERVKNKMKSTKGKGKRKRKRKENKKKSKKK